VFLLRISNKKEIGRANAYRLSEWRHFIIVLVTGTTPAAGLHAFGEE
jgi:hypothetical protein